jgi:molybdopterin molybdotransferase
MAQSLMTVEEARSRLLSQLRPLSSETVLLAAANGRVLAADVRARHRVPNCDCSVMDGYAVRSADIEAARASGRATVVLRCLAESAAGHPSVQPLASGQACRISTGAALPPEADAVVAQEDTSRSGPLVTVMLESVGDLAPGTFVRKQGSDVEADEPLASAGSRLGPTELALFGGGGHERVTVFRRPRVAIVSSGDELAPLGARPGIGQVVSTNATMLAAQIESAGAIAVDLGSVRDDPRALEQAITAATDCELVITSGGISVGEHDHVADVLAALGRIEVRGVALRPGKPTTIAFVHGVAVLALPGNPASTFVAFELFGRPAISRLGGLEAPVHELRQVRARRPFRGSGCRAHYVRARFDDTATGVYPLPTQTSGNLRSIAGTHCLVCVPANVDEIAENEQAQAMVVNPRWYEQARS